MDRHDSSPPAHEAKGVRPHIDELANDALSALTPYSAIILTVSIVAVFLARLYLFEGFLLRRLYGTRYADMATDERVRRGFVNHHVAGTIKLLLLGAASYPFMAVAFGRATLHSAFAGEGESGGGGVTMGDVLVVCSQLFISMYVFELFYRPSISPISALHHMGAIVIAQTAVTLTLDFAHQPDATIEFLMCYVWGGFDVLAEFWPHVAMILYRVYPDNHALLARVFRLAWVVEVGSTTLETVVVMCLFGSLWHKWTLPFKVITPVLHVLFSAAQLWGALVLRKMWKRQVALREEARKRDGAQGDDDDAG